MKQTSKIILLFLALWLLLVSMSAYRFSSPFDEFYKSSDLNQVSFNEISSQGLFLIEPKLSVQNLYQESKCNLNISISLLWFKSYAVCTIIPTPSVQKSYLINVENCIIFKEFLKIFPYHFFF